MMIFAKQTVLMQQNVYMILQEMHVNGRWKCLELLERFQVLEEELLIAKMLIILVQVEIIFRKIREIMQLDLEFHCFNLDVQDNGLEFLVYVL